MRDDIAELVYPVLVRGLRLQERLRRGEQPELKSEQGQLKAMLNKSGAGAAEFGGDGGPLDSMRRDSSRFLGIRYALCCWLDEIFIDAAWEGYENDPLELQLYQTRQRAPTFWHQARLAEQRPGSDALEAFFLCVMLGFRGDLRNDPTRLRAWFDATQARIISGLGQGIFDPNTIPADSVPSYVPARRNRERFRRMVLIWGGTLLASVFLLALFLTLKGGQP